MYKRYPHIWKTPLIIFKPSFGDHSCFGGRYVIVH
jgi:hypothetical protein